MKSTKSAAILEDLDADKSSPLEKVFDLLKTMAGHQAAMSLGSLSAALDMPKTTVHRITAQLERMGYVQREPGSRHMAIAPGLIDLAVDIVGAGMRQGERHEILKALSDEIGESVCIGMRVGNEIVYLDDVTAANALTLRFRTGLRAPLHCTSQGKIYLSRMSDAEFKQVMAGRKLERYTEYTITDPAKLRSVLDKVRAENFATTNQELIHGVVGAAVPIFGPGRKIYATLSFAGPATRMSMEAVSRLHPTLEAAAARLAKTYGVGKRRRE